MLNIRTISIRILQQGVLGQTMNRAKVSPLILVTERQNNPNAAKRTPTLSRQAQYNCRIVLNLATNSSFTVVGLTVFPSSATQSQCHILVKYLQHIEEIMSNHEIQNICPNLLPTYFNR